ncbi:MAG: S8 family serine peptidase [Planctomycetota bacterium]
MHNRTLAWIAPAVLIPFVLTAAPAQASHVPGEVIVHFVQPPDRQMLAQVERSLGQDVEWYVPKHAPHAKGNPGEPHPLSYYRIARIDATANLEAMSGRVAALASVQRAMKNGTPEPTHTPNDPMFPQQWPHQKINSEAGWDVSTGDTSIIVGIIDTGCLLTHEDLQAHIWVNDDPPNGVDDDNNGFIDDTNGWDFVQNDNTVDDVFGHGTEVSGISAGMIDNGVGVAGIANLTIMTAKWWHTSGTDFSVAESTYYSVDNGAHVVNMSLNCQCLMPMTEAAINYADANDVIVVAAAGNSSTSQPGYPSAYPAAIAVCAITQNDQLAGFSNWGSHLDCGAPSPDIVTTSHTGDTAYTTTFGGTSAASPHVAGLAGLVLSADPSLTPAEVRALINDNAQDLGAPGFDVIFGNGRIDVGATMAALGPGCPDFNGDGNVGTADLLQLLDDWGPCAGCPTDLNGDGNVGTADLLELLSVWGPC